MKSVKDLQKSLTLVIVRAIIRIEKGAADRRFAPPVRYEKVTAKFGSYGRLLFLHNLDNQIGKTNKYETKLT